MAGIELRSIDLAVDYDDGPGAKLVFRVHPADAKAKFDPIDLAVTVPRRGTLDEAVARGFRAIHRLAQDLVEKLQPPAAQ